MKKFGETDFTLYYTIFGLELKGYFAICNTGYIHAELDNFSMANTSPKYVCAPSEAPETQIVEKETIIYDRGQVDVSWDKELDLNPIDITANNSGYLIAIICLSVAVVALLGAMCFMVLKKKK